MSPTSRPFEIDPCEPKGRRCALCEKLTLAQIFALVWTCSSSAAMLYISHHGSCDGRMEDFVGTAILMLLGPAIASVLLVRAHSPARWRDRILATTTLLVGLWLAWWFSFVVYRGYQMHPESPSNACAWDHAGERVINSLPSPRDARGGPRK